MKRSRDSSTGSTGSTSSTSGASRSRRHPAQQQWKDDADDDEFQPYQHLHRRLPERFHPDLPYASFIRVNYNGSINISTTGSTSHTCELCNVDIVTTHCTQTPYGGPMLEPLRQHCFTRTHQYRAIRLYNSQASSVTRRCANVQRRMDILTPAIWHLHAHRKLLTVLLNTTQFGSLPPEMHQAEMLVDKNERQETASLLELYALKCICLAKDDAEHGVHDFDSWRAWKSNGWKTLKHDMRDANEIGIIVKSVLEYIDEEVFDEDDHSSQWFYPADHINRLVTRCWSNDQAAYQPSIIRHFDWGGLQCELCKEDMHTTGGVNVHCQLDSHCRRVEQIAELQKCPYKVWCINVKNRLDQFQGAPWTDEMYSKLYWFCMGYQAWSVHRIGTRQHEIQTLLLQYEDNERELLLRLAAWKVVCILNPPPATTAANDNSYHIWADWIGQGWKRRKCNGKSNSADINVIAKHVGQFLGHSVSGTNHGPTNEMVYYSTIMASSPH